MQRKFKVARKDRRRIKEAKDCLSRLLPKHLSRNYKVK